MDFEYRGLDELGRRLNGLRVELTGPAQERMVRAGGKIFRKGMIERAPVLKPGTEGKTSLPPGALKQGIGMTVRRAGTTEATARIGPRGKDLKLKAWDVEYGHRLVVHGAAGEDVEAHPFIRPTFEACKEDAEAAMIAEVEAMVKESENG